LNVGRFSRSRDMDNFFFFRDDDYVLNHATKYLARFNTDRRNAFDPSSPAAPRDNICEAWRFPIVDSYGGGAPGLTVAGASNSYNTVTFVYADSVSPAPQRIGVIGTFATLYQPLSMRRVLWEGEPTRFWSLSYAIPKGQKHRYRFVLEDGSAVSDPVNPQQATTDNGAVWSVFFTDVYSSPVVMERWEIEILYRLAEEILPFQNADASNFLTRLYEGQDRQTVDSQYANLDRLDTSVGEVNFIDNILAREERHHLIDYKICLRLIDRVLRSRNPYIEPAKMNRTVYFDLYTEMESDRVQGWDPAVYASPRYFLYLLRRHVATGAFCHPKYGGNAGGAGWAYLEDRFRAPQPAPGVAGASLFNWRRALEKPLGINADYLG
jgi:hypothetical protein